MKPHDLWQGVPIVVSPLAYRTDVWHGIEFNPNKRRKRYRVVRQESREPCAYQLADGTLVVAPEIMAQLVAQGEMTL